MRGRRFMKKKSIICALIIALPALSFASTEMSFNAEFSPFSQVWTADELTAERGFIFGLSYKANFLFDLPVEAVDLGIAIATGMDFSRGEYSNDSLALNPSEIGFTFTAGFAARFNAGKRSSFLVAPGIRFGFRNDLSYDTSFFAYDFAAALDAGYRLWLTTDDSFKFGIDLGADLSLPFFGTLHAYSSAPKYSSMDADYSGFIAKFYIGVVFDIPTSSAASALPFYLPPPYPFFPLHPPRWH